MHRLTTQEIIAFALGWLPACFLHPVQMPARSTALIGLFAVVALWRLRGELGPRSIAASGFLVCVLLAGWPSPPDGLASHLYDDRADLLVEGTIIEGPRDGPEGAGWVLRVDRIDESAVRPTDLRIWSPERDAARAGDEVELFARCSRFSPKEFPNLPGADRRWHRRGFAGRCSALEPFTILRRRISLRGMLTKRRLEVERTLQKMEQPASGVAIAMLTGTRGFVSDQARDAFRDTGTGHLLAISGLHFGMLAALVWMLAGLVLRRSDRVTRGPGLRRASSVAVVGVMASYLLLVGAPTSASRAWVVVAFVSVGLLLFRRSSGFAALAVAAILLTARHPTMVHDLGFQLSFCATAGIVLFWWRRPKVVDFDPYEYERTTWKRRLRRVGAFVLMSWCATAVTWPLIVGAMGRISTAALVANPLVVPWIGLVVFPTLVVTTVFATVWPAAAKLLLVPQTLLELTIDALGWLATFPGATWCPGIPPSGFVAVTLIAVFWTIGSRMRLSTVAAAATVVGAMVAHLELRTPPAALRLHFIPVGQGDATLVEFPGGERVLFDAGGTRFGRDPGRWVVVPYLWRLGIARLDALVVTHDDVDHSGGVPGVLSEIDVGRVVTEPEPLHIPGVEVARLMAEGSSNDRSIVASIRQMGSTALLTGDVERAAETAWLAAPEQVTVLKVPHHGSLTSSSPAFLDHSDPIVAVVSAGRHNRFGHPHPAVVDRYRDRAIPLFSTARNGLIVVQVDPDGTLTVRTVR